MIEEIKTVSINDKNYPKLLKEIKDPPEVLFYRGELKPKENCFAIVGTRMSSPYGKQVALEIAGDLAEAGLIIVSGLAPGIDTFSHQAAVERGKRTIAVLGTGLDEKSIYPQSNLKLAKKIFKKIPIIYTSRRFREVGWIWKNSLNETAKILAICNYFPELNHNEQ